MSVPQERMFDLIPGMELTPAAPAYTLKPPESAKSPIQVQTSCSNVTPPNYLFSIKSLYVYSLHRAYDTS